MAWELDPRIEEFVEKILVLPGWNLVNTLVPLDDKTDHGIKRLIDHTIRDLNDAMEKATRYLLQIKAQAEKDAKTYADGGWPYPGLSGSTWVDTIARDYTLAVNETYRLRELTINLVACARNSGVLPWAEKKEG